MLRIMATTAVLSEEPADGSLRATAVASPAGRHRDRGGGGTIRGSRRVESLDHPVAGISAPTGQFRAKPLKVTWPAVVVSAAAGVLIVGLAYRMSAAAVEPNLYYATFWVGMLTAVLPLAARLTLSGTSRADRAWAIALLGAVTAVPKYLRNPTQPLYHDEYAHWREAVDVLSTGRLLRPNSLIPIVQFFPGTSGLTAGVERLTGLSVWSSGQLIVVATHMLGLFAVFVLAEVHLRSARAGAIAALVYSLNPSAMYFDTQYAYESVAIGLFLWVLALASIAGQAKRPGHRIGFTVAAVLCSAGCVVTHHLTTLFLLMFLFLISATITVRGRLTVRKTARTDGTAAIPADDRWVWWTVLGSTIVLGGLWLVFVALPTVDYLSPYFAGSVHQLATMVSTGDGSRELLAASTPPQWERTLTAIAPAVVGVSCLAGILMLRREHANWPSATLALMAFGLIYFPSVPFVLAPSGAEGARRSWAFTYVGVSLILTLIALRKSSTRNNSTRSRWRAAVAVVLLSVVLIGNVGGGLNDPYRFPGPFRWGTDTDSASDEARTIARELAAQAGPVRVVTDVYTALQLVAYGGLNVAVPSAGFPAWNLVQTPDDPSPELAQMLHSSGYDYLVVDLRMAEQPPFNGQNFGPGDPLSGRVTPIAYLQRLDSAPWATRIISSDHLRVYRLDLTKINAAGGAG